MKLNRHNTALHFLQPGEFTYALRVAKNWNPVSIEVLRQHATAGFIKKRELYKKRIQYISDPFLEAYRAAKDRITIDLLGDERMDEHGTMIVRREDGGRNTIFYSTHIGRGEDGVMAMKGSVLMFGTDHAKETKLQVLNCAYIQSDVKGQPWQYIADGDIHGLGLNTDKEMAPMGLWVDITFLLLFMRYCEVETKVVQPGRKVEHVANKYINDTSQPVEIVDSTWFTTIVRSEGFGVKGHFRLQPYPSLGIKRLIYIHPFEKKGYTRKAKILANGESKDPV